MEYSVMHAKGDLLQSKIQSDVTSWQEKVACYDTGGIQRQKSHPRNKTETKTFSAAQTNLISFLVGQEKWNLIERGC